MKYGSAVIFTVFLPVDTRPEQPVTKERSCAALLDPDGIATDRGTPIEHGTGARPDRFAWRTTRSGLDGSYFRKDGNIVGDDSDKKAAFNIFGTCKDLQ